MRKVAKCAKKARERVFIMPQLLISILCIFFIFYSYLYVYLFVHADAKYYYESITKKYFACVGEYI